MNRFATAGAAFAAAVFACITPLAAQQAPELPATAPRGRFADYVHDATNPFTWASPLASAVYDQTQDTPEGWNEDSDGMGRRLASSAGKTAISLTVKHGTAALLGVPAHPVHCASATGGARLLEAALEPIGDRTCSGALHPSVPRLAGRVASRFAPLLWHQPGYTASKAATGIATGIATSALLKVGLAIIHP
jgi:hypothetical protein